MILKRLTVRVPDLVHPAILTVCENCPKINLRCHTNDCHQATKERLAAIEDILGDKYDLDWLRRIVSVARWAGYE